jgi:hypothetical protein
MAVPGMRKGYRFLACDGAKARSITFLNSVRAAIYGDSLGQFTDYAQVDVRELSLAFRLPHLAASRSRRYSCGSRVSATFAAQSSRQRQVGS